MKTLWKVLKRDLGAQFNRSRNMNEGLGLKCKRCFWSVAYTLRGVKCGARAMRREQLGSTVRYKGMRCSISNWAGTESPTLCGPNGFYERNAPRCEIVNVITAGELCHRFMMMFGWYMSCWHGINVNQRLYPHIYPNSTDEPKPCGKEVEA